MNDCCVSIVLTDIRVQENGIIRNSTGFLIGRLNDDVKMEDIIEPPEPPKDILGALARGYCTDRNSKKVLDPDLIEDMLAEVLKVLGPADEG